MRYSTRRRPATNKPLTAPTDIREDKALRTAWLAAKVAELQAQGYEARISGTGTLQAVRYALPKARQTKLQLRGLCQCCGRLQALQGDRLVKHGYRRPGYGWQTASCSGTYQLPLSESCEHTRLVARALTEQLSTAKTPNEHHAISQMITYLREIVANWEAGKYTGTTREYEVEA